MGKVIELHKPETDDRLDALNAEVVAKYAAMKEASRIWTDAVFRRAAYIALKRRKAQDLPPPDTPPAA